MDLLPAAWHSEGQGFESPRVHHALSHDIEEPVSGHRRVAQLWNRLIATIRVKGQLTQHRAVFGDDLELSAGDEQGHRLTSSLVADIEMAKPAEVADRDLAVAIELVAADAVLNRGSGT